jgi:hypothetical protein
LKRRTGFVSNSSSASFILSFKDDEDYKKFEDYCDEFEYQAVFKLVDNIKHRQENGIPDLNNEGKIGLEELREKCLAEMEHFFTFEDVLQFMDEKFKGMDYKERIAKEREIRETPEFKEFYKSLFVKMDKKKVTDDYLEEQLKDIPKESEEYSKKFMAVIMSPEYRDLLDTARRNNMYFDGVEKLKEDQIIVEGMIWDTNGGLLEWSIRQGILQEEFPQWVRMCENVG